MILDFLYHDKEAIYHSMFPIFYNILLNIDILMYMLLLIKKVMRNMKPKIQKN